MGRKSLVCALLAVLLAFSAAALAQSYSRSALRLLHAIHRQPTLLARAVYLQHRMPMLSVANQRLAGQFLAFSQDEMGLYTRAVLSFPLKARLPDHLQLPDPKRWTARPAVDVIVRRARGRHIVMINEAHHDAHTRELMLELLPRLKALGFKYFAAEALSDDDPGLMRRGYPVRASGSEYLREPVYGDIVREAIRLGFTIVPYDTENVYGQARENGQAEHLYRRVFAKHPQARLVVHAGYAHIDKAPGRLRELRPMAMRLRKLSGFEPLSIDQIEFLETGFDGDDAYHRLIAAFPTHVPEVFVNRHSGQTWSDRPGLFDMNVILPTALSMDAFAENLRTPFSRNIRRTNVRGLGWHELIRPHWLTLNGQRHAFVIDTQLCRGHVPCVVAARRLHERADAGPADVYAFMGRGRVTRLYLRPGRYRLRAANAAGKTLSSTVIRVPAH